MANSIQWWARRASLCLLGLALLASAGPALADPPSRVARLGYLSGSVSLSPAGLTTWDAAALNRPLSTGDRLWSEAGARAELQIGGAAIRMNASTGLSVLNLDDQITQLRLTEGGLSLHISQLGAGQLIEVDTPNLALTLRQPADLRIEVAADGSSTTIQMRQGQGEVSGEQTAWQINAGQGFTFSGTGLREYQRLAAPPADEFDQWAGQRDQQRQQSASARYVSPDVVGYQDLDANGTWEADATYGHVWMPSHVAADWAPYRDGHWAWVAPWGWTWVDDAPWGFAVSHYGRWAQVRGHWGWVPGPVARRAYYAPALVVFVGSPGLQLSVTLGAGLGMAWFPLGPHEAYRPAYANSRRYFENVNQSNTVVSNTVIHNTYIQKNVTKVVYVNRRVPGALVAVPREAFLHSRPVRQARLKVADDVAARAPLAAAPHEKPPARLPSPAQERKPGRNAAPADDAPAAPPAHSFERKVIARTPPPASQRALVQATPRAPKATGPLPEAATAKPEGAKAGQPDSPAAGKPEAPGARNKPDAQAPQNPRLKADKPGAKQPAPADAKATPADNKPTPADNKPASANGKPASADNKPEPKNDKPTPADNKPARADKPADNKPAPADNKPARAAERAASAALRRGELTGSDRAAQPPAAQPPAEPVQAEPNRANKPPQATQREAPPAPTRQPGKQPDQSQPANDRTDRPRTAAPVATPTPTPAPKPAPRPEPQAAPQPAAQEPRPKPAAEQRQQRPAANAPTQPEAQPRERPNERSNERPNARPAERQTERQTERSTERPGAQPAEPRNAPASDDKPRKENRREKQDPDSKTDNKPEPKAEPRGEAPRRHEILT